MTTANITENPHFKNVDRAPYELAYLLRHMPEGGFHYSEPLTPDQRLMAEAARRHTMNARSTLIHGLEAIGQYLMVAGLNDENDVEKRSLVGLGELISHVATEYQFLEELESSLRETLLAQDARDTSETSKPKGGK